MQHVESVNSDRHTGKTSHLLNTVVWMTCPPPWYCHNLCARCIPSRSKKARPRESPAIPPPVKTLIHQMEGAHSLQMGVENSQRKEHSVNMFSKTKIKNCTCMETHKKKKKKNSRANLGLFICTFKRFNSFVLETRLETVYISNVNSSSLSVYHNIVSVICNKP